MTNRVEELESRVAELESTVDGLIEELVLVSDRLRDLEEPADGGDGSRRRADGRDGGPIDNPQDGSGRKADTTPNEGPTGEDVSDEIIVA